MNSANIAQRALEALRNGVPNSDAVRALRCMQPEPLDRFRRQLDLLSSTAPEQQPPVVPGMLIAGDFGCGKSHTLSFLQQEALERNFVVSHLVISKETPLHDPAKLFQAAVRKARIPGARGSLLHELAARVDYRSEHGRLFLEWVRHRQPSGMLAASVVIDERSQNAGLKDKILNWWSGEKIGIGEIREELRSLDVARDLTVKVIKMSELAPIRFEFAARLARAAGFSGWVLLLDEIELISRYSLLQRGRAYAELARWLATIPEHGVSGLTAVAAITADFDIAVLKQRNDIEFAPKRLKRAGDTTGLAQATLATSGIEMIMNGSVRLHPPNDDSLQRSHDTLREIYKTAYGYASASKPVAEQSTHRAMRSYVRRWICDWDLDRLYGERASSTVEEESIPVDYSEDQEFDGSEEVADE